MGTLYITQEDSFIGKTDERLTVKANQKNIIDVPFIKLEGVVAFGRATVSPMVINELLQRHIPLTFLTNNGKYLGCLAPELTKNIFIRKAQWNASGESDQAIHLVQGFVRGKLKNYHNFLQRKQRDNELNLTVECQQLKSAIASVKTTYNIDSLRGLEGAGSAAYFSCFNKLITNPDFEFKKRVRRPPTDPVNSLLSLGYALLRHDVQSAINIVGFDPYLGYLHVERYGRPSLALDLMEEFRPIIVDQVVLNTINKGILTLADFTTEPISNAVSLTKDGLQKFLRLYQEKKLSKFKHPVLKRQYSYQESFEIQARFVAKYLMGETNNYPPLIIY